MKHVKLMLYFSLQVLDHWKKFKEYDTDHDCSLDLSEVCPYMVQLIIDAPITLTYLFLKMRNNKYK